MVIAAPVEHPVGPAGRRRGPAAYGSDLIVDLLHALGYRYLPLTPGSSFRGLHDSLVNHGGNRDPQLLLCLHEEIAVSLAHGHAKATGGPAVAVVHDLVGLMHASMAVYNAFCDRVPLLLLGGSGPADRSRRRPVDWLHSAITQAELVRDFVKWDDEPATAADAVTAVLRADQLARSAPPGPVYVSLDLAEQERALDGPIALPDPARHAPAPPLHPDPAAVERAAEVLARAAFPVVVGGRVGRDPAATTPLQALVEACGAAYTDDRHQAGLPTAHPQNCSGDATLLADADVVVTVEVADPATLGGVDLARVTVVDLSLGDVGIQSWSGAAGPPLPRDVHLGGDPLWSARVLAEAAAERVDPAARISRAGRVRDRHAALRAGQREALAAGFHDRPIRPGRLAAETWAAVRELPWLLVLRNTRSWPEGVWEFPGAGRYLGHSGGGGVGYGPGAMVGGALAARDRGQLAVAIVGDGDLLMAAGALWTALHYRVPLLVVVNDNGSFDNDEQHQRRVAARRGRPEENAAIGTRIADPAVDIAGLARSYGCWATGPVEDPDALGPALGEAAGRAAAGEVAVVCVRTAPQDRG
jgi:thiamine pyrophosphate-dependent acetolactate synthase large subunit-like protein